MRIIITVVFIIVSFMTFGQHTFSIVAVDPLTGEVGGAGATCYATVNDIADVHPGVGFIHTQSFVNYNNQAYAKDLMDLNLSPQSIMDSLALNDVGDSASYRQYAAVDLINGGRSAAFTGNMCYSYYGERLGPSYAIAGNILLGPQILDSMEARFNTTQGTLADKLMAALQGAKVPGADQRCLPDGISSLSAYMIVAKPSDTQGNYFLDLNVENVFPGEPIDALQSQYDSWLSVDHQSGDKGRLKIYPNPISDKFELFVEHSTDRLALINITDQRGKLVLSESLIDKRAIQLQHVSEGLYLYQVKNEQGRSYNGKILIN